MRKNIALFLLSATLLSHASMHSYAEVYPTNQWVQTGETWKLTASSQDKFLSNGWYKDTDDNWYLLDTNGNLMAGIVYANGYYYYLNENHDGTYGKLVTKPDSYTVNNKQIHLSFTYKDEPNSNDNSLYGTITNNLEQLRGEGALEGLKEAFPTDSEELKAYPTVPDSESWKTKPFDQMTDEELDRLLEKEVGGKSANIGTIDIEANKGMKLDN